MQAGEANEGLKLNNLSEVDKLNAYCKQLQLSNEGFVVKSKILKILYENLYILA